MSPIRRAGLVLVTVLTGLAVLAGCTVSTNDEPVAVDDVFDGLVESTTTTVPVTSAPTATKSVTMYFLRSTEEQTELVPVERELAVEAGAQRILSDLFSRPPAEDGPVQERGLSSAIPGTAVLLSTDVPAGTERLVIDTRGLFGDEGVQSIQLRNALGQIVCTATELPQINEVSFQNEGRSIGAIIGNSETAEGPVSCSDYRSLN